MLQYLHKGAIINKGALLDLLLALVLMFPLYNLFGLPGVALSFVISTYIQVAYYLWHTSKLTGLHLRNLLPFKDWSIKLLLSGVLLWVTRFTFIITSKEELKLAGGSVVMILISVCFFFATIRARK